MVAELSISIISSLKFIVNMTVCLYNIIIFRKCIVAVWPLSCVQLFCNPSDCSPSDSSVQGISQQEYWSSLPFPSLGDLPNPGIKHACPALAGRFFTTESPGKPEQYIMFSLTCICNFYFWEKTNTWSIFPLSGSVFEWVPGLWKLEERARKIGTS